MQSTEKIPVFMRIREGVTICICHVSRKRCNLPCERGVVERDKYEKWQATMRRDRFGR
ncbi:MAG: hypothetical protein IJJ67_01130 [Oscillospiraceae bacterium]|nr:hypothetical protein [Oscillospiraceae bacterium]